MLLTKHFVTCKRYKNTSNQLTTFKNSIMTTLEINTQKAKQFLKNNSVIKIHSLLETFILFPYDYAHYMYNGDLYRIDELQENFSIKIYDVECI